MSSDPKNSDTYYEASSFSSSTVQQTGKPTVHEEQSKYVNSTGDAHVKHVRSIGDKKSTKEWHKEGDKPANFKNTIENADATKFDEQWEKTTEPKAQPTATIKDQ